MKVFARLFLLSAVMFTGLSISHAEGVTNVRVEANSDYVSMFWDALPSDKLNGAEGYALQFSDRQTNVQINKVANLFLRPGETSISLRRNSFTNNVYYYTRVYSYGIDDETNAKVKANGSKLVKWKVDGFNRVEKTETTVNDPVVTVNSSSSTSTSKDALFDFGELRSTAFDTFLNISWSKPVLMATSDFDGFLVKISTNSDLSDPILTQTYDRDQTRSRIKGLQPNTQYYVGAYFYERKGGQDVTFGNKNIKAVKTIAAIPRDGSTRAARNIVKIEKGFYGKHVMIDGSNNTTASTTSTTPTTSTSNTRTTSSSIMTSSTANINRASQSTVRARIAALKEQVRELQTELRRWEAKLDGNTQSSTTTSTRSTSTRSTSASSNTRLSKLKALLEARRNAR